MHHASRIINRYGETAINGIMSTPTPTHTHTNVVFGLNYPQDVAVLHHDANMSMFQAAIYLLAPRLLPPWADRQ